VKPIELSHLICKPHLAIDRSYRIESSSLEGELAGGHVCVQFQQQMLFGILPGSMISRERIFCSAFTER